MPGIQDLSDHEKTLIDNYLEFYDSLRLGKREPNTEGQLLFVEFCKGRRKPETEHEVAYAKYLDHCAEPTDRKKLFSNPTKAPAQKVCNSVKHKEPKRVAIVDQCELNTIENVPNDKSDTGGSSYQMYLSSLTKPEPTAMKEAILKEAESRCRATTSDHTPGTKSHYEAERKGIPDFEEGTASDSFFTTEDYYKLRKSQYATMKSAHRSWK